MRLTIGSSLKWFKERWFHDRNFAIWTVSLLTVAIRLLASIALKSYRFGSGDDHFAFGYEWGRIAGWLVDRGIFSNDGVVPTADTDPLYVFIIAPFFQIFGTFSTGAAIGLIVFQSVICGLSTWALFVLAERLYGPTEARVSALLFAFYPASIAFAVARIGPSSISILLICLIFILMLEAAKTTNWRPAMIAGFLMGGLALATAHLISLVVIVPLWLFFFSNGARIRRAVLSLVFLGATVLVVLPWSIRNSLQLGHATISKANLGYHLWTGNNPEATGYRRTTPIPDDNFYRQHGEHPKYVQLSAAWIAEHPEKFFLLTLKRVKYFWYKIPEETHDGSPRYELHVWSFMAVLALGVLGMSWSRQRWQKISLLLLYLGVYPLLFYLTHVTHYRHRFHIEPFILVLAAHGLHRLWALRPVKLVRSSALERTASV